MGWGPRSNPEPGSNPDPTRVLLASRAPAAAVPASRRPCALRAPPPPPPDQPSAVAPPPRGRPRPLSPEAGPTWRGMVRDTIAPGRQVCVRMWGCPASSPPPVPGTVLSYCCLPRPAAAGRLRGAGGGGAGRSPAPGGRAAVVVVTAGGHPSPSPLAQAWYSDLTTAGGKGGVDQREAADLSQGLGSVASQTWFPISTPLSLQLLAASVSPSVNRDKNAACLTVVLR